jgi:hypothetical protein
MRQDGIVLAFNCPALIEIVLTFDVVSAPETPTSTVDAEHREISEPQMRIRGQGVVQRLPQGFGERRCGFG